VGTMVAFFAIFCSILLTYFFCAFAPAITPVAIFCRRRPLSLPIDYFPPSKIMPPM